MRPPADLPTSTKKPFLAAFAMLAICCWQKVASGGEWIEHFIESERLAGNLIGEPASRSILVYLPGGYEESQQDYPVVYWFPGGNLSRTHGIDLDRIDDEFTSGRSEPSIIVFMDAITTFRSSIFLSSEAFGDWEGHMIDEVIPFVDQTYRTRGSPRERGVMGFSLGGFTSLMLPIRAPNSFGAIGANDPSTALISGMVRSEEQLPEGVMPDDDFDLDEFLEGFPAELTGYQDSTVVYSAWGQVAASLNPNPVHPLHGELPFDAEGNWIPENRQRWSEWDLLNPDSVRGHQAALQALTSVSVILPDAEEFVDTPWNREMIQVFQSAGIAAQGIEAEGDHNDFIHERFAMLLSNVSNAITPVATETLTSRTYQQTFDASLGVNDQLGVKLPTGWSVTDHQAHIFRGRTNTPFHDGAIEPVGHAPHILNAGEVNDPDRSLAVYLPADAEPTTIQFVGDLVQRPANMLRLGFDAEVWDQIGTEGSDVGEVSFQVTAELDFGMGFEDPISLGTATAGTAGPLDGNALDHRISFTSRAVLSTLGDAASIRLRWTTDTAKSATEPWAFGLDNVQLDLLLAGDVDQDGILTPSDMDALSLALRTGEGRPEHDLNEDGLVDLADRDYWIHELVGTTPGDTNLDRSVDFDDFSRLAEAFNTQAGWSSGDFDGDGLVTFADFSIMSNHLGPAVTQSIPESSTNSMLLWIPLLCPWRWRWAAVR